MTRVAWVVLPVAASSEFSLGMTSESVKEKKSHEVFLDKESLFSLTADLDL